MNGSTGSNEWPAVANETVDVRRQRQYDTRGCQHLAGNFGTERHCRLAVRDLVRTVSEGWVVTRSEGNQGCSSGAPKLGEP